jgi:hypothetical protein
MLNRKKKFHKMTAYEEALKTNLVLAKMVISGLHMLVHVFKSWFFCHKLAFT